ncbi:MAG: transporter substrate-binding domain-containing protein [Treponema sp.]|nr:transporter substrate-binding domain-containing protein [Treponema sp.]
MKYIIKIVIIFSLIITALTGCPEKSNNLTLKKGILLVGVNTNYQPINFILDDVVNLAGFEISLAKAIGEKLGLEVQFINANEGIYIHLGKDRSDCVISSVTITEHHLKSFNFSIPYLQNTLVIVMLNDSQHSVSSPGDLKGLRVAYQSETISQNYIEQLGQEGILFTPFEYDSLMSCFNDLHLGRIHAVMTDLITGIEYISSDSLKIVWQGEEEIFGICLKKGNDALTEVINKALYELFEDGTILRISKEFFKGRDLVSMLHIRQ